MEQRDPAACDSFGKMGGRGEMIKAPISLQDLRRRIYVKAKAEPSWRFYEPVLVGARASVGSGGVADGCMRNSGSSETTG